MVSQRAVTTLQFLGAALGIPAAAAGSWSVMGGAYRRPPSITGS